MLTRMIAISATSGEVSHGIGLSMIPSCSSDEVEDPAVLLQDGPPRRAADDQRDQPGQQEQRPEHSVEREVLVEEQGEQHPEHELADDRTYGEQRGVGERLAEHVVGYDGQVVLQADPGCLPGEECPERVLLEAHGQVLDHRVAEQRDDGQEGRHHEEDLVHLLPAPTPLAVGRRWRAGGGGGLGRCVGQHVRIRHGRLLSLAELRISWRRPWPSLRPESAWPVRTSCMPV